MEVVYLVSLHNLYCPLSYAYTYDHQNCILKVTGTQVSPPVPSKPCSPAWVLTFLCTFQYHFY